MNLTTKSRLFELINSLSTSEKRYLKQYINKSGEANSNHAKLFEAIAKQDVYDEEKLKKKLKNTSLIKQWSRVKNYLYHYILRVLQSYHQQDMDFELYNNIQQVSILNKKGLYQQANKLLKKTKYLALDGGQASMLPLIAEMEMVIDNLVWYNQEEKDRLDYKENNVWATEIAHNMLQYNAHCIDVFTNGVKKGRSTKLEDINKAMLDAPQYQSIEAAKSPMAKWFFYVAKVVLHAQIGEFIEAYSNAKACMEMHKEFPLLQKYSPLTYISSLNNFVQSTIDAEQWQEIPFITEEIEHYITKHKTSPKVLYLTCIKYVAILQKHIKHAEFEEALTYVLEIEAFLIKNESANTRYTKPHILLHDLVHIYIINAQYDKALEHTESLEKIQQVPIYNNTTLLLKLIILFEQDEFTLLPYAIRAAYRALLKKKELYGLERIILNLLKSSANVASKKELNTVFVKYLHKLRLFIQTAPKKELELLNYFDYLAWMESKVKRVDLLDLLKERHLSKTTNNLLLGT